MASRTRRKVHNSDDFLTEGVMTWVAGGVLCYSFLVLLLAMESMAVAEFALRFQLLNQLAVIGMILLGTVGLFSKAVVSGWKRANVLPIFALVLLLPGAQPADGCCGKLVAFIAGHPSAVAPVSLDVLWHVLPMLGCGLLIADEVNNRRKSVTTAKKRQERRA